MSSELCFYVWLLKRNKMICDNIGLVPFVYNKYFRHNSSLNLIEDLIQAGYCGLITAVDKFDESRNVKFSAFAVNVIKQQMIKEIKRLSFALGTRNKRNGEPGETSAFPFHILTHKIKKEKPLILSKVIIAKMKILNWMIWLLKLILNIKII